MPLQCIYRYSIVKTGNRPQGFKLFIYIVLTLTSFFLQFYMSFATIDVSDANFSLRHDSTEILRHVGYSLNESEIHGIFRSSPSWISPTKMAITIITYSIVIYCIVMIRKFLRNRSLTKATKRLNRDMDLMLSCLAITPLISTLVPYVLVVTRIRSCENDEMINFFISILPQLTELISASSTIYWVRPYREILLNMFGLKKINNHVIESVQVTVRPTPTFNQLTN
ncbi:hypothetical protein M3Y95_00895800 [Aphelenchoides besseyi]|nr:hypothetical protein M3Y95_00895800 [Aphelenchoides besseyi]